jgi:hypothetical protein
MRHFGWVVLGVLAACGPDTVAAPDNALQPPCVLPAPLVGEFDPQAPHFIVIYRDGVDSQKETDRLAQLYGFEPRFVYQYAIQGFSAELEPSVLASVRCEVTVDYVAYDGSVHATGGSASL